MVHFFDVTSRFQRFQIFKRKPVIKKRLSDISNPLESESDEYFRKKYRFQKSVVAEFILPLVADELTAIQGGQVPILLQVLLALRFYACGSFQQVVGDTTNISQASVCRIIRKVSRVIASLRKSFVKFPSHEKAALVRSNFYDIAGFPGVIGAIDCTHVRIVSPGGDDAKVYRNRKGYFSINVQATCTPDLKFSNVVARWKGSTHDSRIFENSKLYFNLTEGRTPPGHLLGDSGYACRNFLLTPFLKPRNNFQKRYNKAHVLTRNPIERSFGVLKKRFYCVGNVLRTRLDTSLVIIVTCVVLHNIGIDCRDMWDDDEEEANDDTDEGDNFMGSSDAAGNRCRNHIVDEYFSS